MKGLTPGNSCSSTSTGVSSNECPRQNGKSNQSDETLYEYTHAALDISSISHIYRRGTREKSMKPIAEDVIVNAYYIHFDYLLSCIPINGKILKLEGSFVIREVYASRSYNITRFVPTAACHQDCMRNNNIRVSGEMCEESLYDNYEKTNQGLVDKLHGSRDTLQDIIDQIDQNIGSLPELSQTSKEIERPARFPNWDSELINRSSAPRRREVSLASVGSE
jgi:hypothetical protein